MNKYILPFSFLFIPPCKELAEQGGKDNVEIVSVSKVMRDESEIVYQDGKMLYAKDSLPQ